MGGIGVTETQDQRTKTTDGQIFAILLLVTFAVLILTTPAYVLFVYIMYVDFFVSPKLFAGYNLFYNVSYKLQITNYGTNFFLYVMSGRKFRIDLVKLFVKEDQQNDSVASKRTESSSV